MSVLSWIVHHRFFKVGTSSPVRCDSPCSTMSIPTIAFHSRMNPSVTGPGTSVPTGTPFKLLTGVMVGLVLAVKASSAL